MKKLAAVMIISLFVTGCAVQQGGSKRMGGSLYQPVEQEIPASGVQPAAPASKY
ncbi:MAG: hypothetical protein PHY48_15430 [Candidatus Cloacimonetes bacterium]|nr:hypothetical protein [Candidatus Cloacimonadota bacterium]